MEYLIASLLYLAGLVIVVTDDSMDDIAKVLWWFGSPVLVALWITLEISTAVVWVCATIMRVLDGLSGHKWVKTNESPNR